MPLSERTTPLTKRKLQKAGPVTYGEALREVECDHVIKTEPQENSRRRTIVLEKKENSWGFTLQSYGIHNKKLNEVELLTYVDYVDIGGAAYDAGLRPGDVILSINGISVENVEHMSLVNFIKSCGNIMRMVVLFEDCCRKVELHTRRLKLKKMLQEKVFELRSLEDLEKKILGKRLHHAGHLSLASSTTSVDAMSMDCVSLYPELDVCSYFDRRRMGSHSLLSRNTLSPVSPTSSFEYGSLPMRGEKARRAKGLGSGYSPSLVLNSSSSIHLNSTNASHYNRLPSLSPQSSEYALQGFTMSSISEADYDESIQTSPLRNERVQSASLTRISDDVDRRLEPEDSDEILVAHDKQIFVLKESQTSCSTPLSSSENLAHKYFIGSTSELPGIEIQNIDESSTECDALTSSRGYHVVTTSSQSVLTPQIRVTQPTSSRAHDYSDNTNTAMESTDCNALVNSHSANSGNTSFQSGGKENLSLKRTASHQSFIKKTILTQSVDLSNTLAGSANKKNSNEPQLVHFRRIYSDVLPSYLNLHPASIEQVLRLSHNSLPQYFGDAVAETETDKSALACKICGLRSCVCALNENRHANVTTSVSYDNIAESQIFKQANGDLGNKFIFHPSLNDNHTKGNSTVKHSEVNAPLYVSCGLLQNELINEEDADTYL